MTKTPSYIPHMARHSLTELKRWERIHRDDAVKLRATADSKERQANELRIEINFREIPKVREIAADICKMKAELEKPGISKTRKEKLEKAIEANQKLLDLILQHGHEGGYEEVFK